MIRFALLTLILVTCRFAQGQHLFLKTDLRPEWQTYSNGEFSVISGLSNQQTIYLWLSPREFRGDQFLVESSNEFSVILGNEVVQSQTRHFAIPVDSVAVMLKSSDKVLVGVHQPGGIQGSLKTLIMSDIGFASSAEDAGPVAKPRNSSSNFVVVCFLLLTAFFAGILGINPKLTSHFFSLRSLFAQRDIEEGQAQSRISSGPNMVFYGFVSLLSGYVIVLTSQHVGAVETTYGYLSLLWLRVSAVVFVVLMIKAITIIGFATLFGIGELARVQFLNFIRVTLLIMLLIAVLISGYSVAIEASANGYTFFFHSIEWVLAGWVGLSFLTLLRRVPFSLFHLFSYICLTELIPFFLVVNILYE